MPQDVTDIVTKRTFNKDSNFFIIAAMVAAEERTGKPIPRAEKYEVVFTINGYELKLDDAVKAFVRDYDRHIREEVVKYLGEEHLDRLVDDVEDLRKKVLETMRKRLGLPEEGD